MRSGDVLVVVLVLIVILIWGVSAARRWLENPRKKTNITMQVPRGEVDFEPNEVTELLEGAGFDVLAAKARVPVLMTLNDREQYQSRLYIDYFAEKQGELYLVKVARERKPLEMTGSGIRDALLYYYLLYPDATGVLYVDMNAFKIKKITFHIEV